MAEQEQTPEQLLQPRQQQLQQAPGLHGVATEALTLLEQELDLPQPSVSRASVVLGIVQERLFSGQNDQQSLAAAVAQLAEKFHQQLVIPAAAKLGPKCKATQDKVVAVAKFLRGKLAKAPAHKQPLHTQYLPSALRDQGKRQLDCLGIATAVLGMCHAIAAEHSAQHADLAAARLIVSDDHCWLALPQQQQQQAGPAAVSSSDLEIVQQLLHIEVTDPRPLKVADMASWLYAGGSGCQPCSTQQAILILVAGLMPEELKDESAAAQLAALQMALLGRLAARHPDALFYSNFFRWGMLHEEEELQQLVAAAGAGNTGELQRLAMLGPQLLQSQCRYAESVQRSSGMQWHPHSCAAFGWLNRLQAALCGDTDELLLLSSSWQAKAAAATAAGSNTTATASAGRVDATFWLGIATHLFNQALAAVGGCTAVLRWYAGAAGKPEQSADKQLLEAVRDLWANLADSCKALAALQHMADTEQQQQQQQQQQQEQQQQQQQRCVTPSQLLGPAAQGQVLAAATTAAVPAAAVGEEGVGSAAGPDSEDVVGSRADCKLQPGSSSEAAGGHVGSDVPAAAPVTGHNLHLAAAVANAPAGQQQQQQQQLELATEGILSNSSWQQALLQLMDAVCAYFGDDSADLPAAFVRDFLVCAAAFTGPARVHAASQAAASQVLHSSRVRALGEAATAAAVAWQEMALDLQQLLQMPGNRKRKRKEP